MVILGFAGFGWVLGGFGGFGFVGLVWWDLGVVVGLWVCCVDCGYMDKKRGFVWVFWGGFWGGLGFGGKFAPGSCLICENLSTFQNSQNFVNFHLSKIKGGT